MKKCRVRFYHTEYEDEFYYTDKMIKMNDFKYVNVKDIKKKRLFIPVNMWNKNDLFTKLGFIQGDGTLTTIEYAGKGGIEISVAMDKDEEIRDLFNFSYDKRTYYTHEYTQDILDLGFILENIPYRGLPTTFDKWGEHEKLSFIRGLYSANGSVIRRHRVALKSTCKEMIIQLNDYLHSIGIESYYTTNKSKENKFSNGMYIMKESYDLNISQIKSIIKFAENIGFVHKYKMRDLFHLIQQKSPKVSSVKIIN